MSYLRRKPEDEVWYIHSPLKKGNRELVTAPPPSQIPYLNDIFDDEATKKSKEPVAYPRPSWWDAMCEQIPSPENSNDNQEKKPNKSEHVFGAPDWFVHSEHKRSPDKSKQS
jgi:hypothetical protein